MIKCTLYSQFTFQCQTHDQHTNICLTDGARQLTIQVFWDVTLSSWLDISSYFEIAEHFHLHGQEANKKGTA